MAIVRRAYSWLIGLLREEESDPAEAAVQMAEVGEELTEAEQWAQTASTF